MKIIFGIIGGIFMFLGIQRFIAVHESYRYFGYMPILDCPQNREMLNGVIGEATIFSIIGLIFFAGIIVLGRKKVNNLEKEKKELEEQKKKLDQLSHWCSR